MYQMTDEEFEASIEEALDAMPEQFLQALENIAVVWEYEPSDYHLGYDEDGMPLEEDGEEPWATGACPADDLERAEDWDEDGDWDDEGDDGYEPLPTDLLGLFDGLSLVERAEGGYDVIFPLHLPAL